VRLRIDLAYDGAGFHGWAAQPELRTVQGELEAGLRTVLRVPQIATVCAGRTDTGVHARGQVVHLDVEAGVLEAAAGRDDGDPGGAVARRLNGVLAPDVRVRRICAAPDGFDARFSPLWRRYVYRVGDQVPDPLTRGHVLSWPRHLGVEAMNRASAGLLGLRDFAAFCKQREGATTTRTLLELTWARHGDLVTATVRADAFCHHMVRSLVGCLLAVGDGRQGVGWPAEVLGAAVRDPRVAVVPPHGLTLEEVAYPPDHELAARAEQSRTRRATP
jgi:tRNA pseudouridine38-40 synthase